MWNDECGMIALSAMIECRMIKLNSSLKIAEGDHLTFNTPHSSLFLRDNGERPNEIDDSEDNQHAENPLHHVLTLCFLFLLPCFTLSVVLFHNVEF